MKSTQAWPCQYQIKLKQHSRVYYTSLWPSASWFGMLYHIKHKCTANHIVLIVYLYFPTDMHGKIDIRKSLQILVHLYLDVLSSSFNTVKFNTSYIFSLSLSSLLLSVSDWSRFAVTSSTWLYWLRFSLWLLTLHNALQISLCRSFEVLPEHCPGESKTLLQQ